MKPAPWIALLTAIAILALPAFILPAKAVPPAAPRVLFVAGDTLDTSPMVAATIARWTPADARAFCITSYAQWPGYLYVRHLAPAETIACENTRLMLVQLPACPSPAEMNDAPPFVVVQCGPADFRRNRDSTTTPANDGGRIA